MSDIFVEEGSNLSYCCLDALNDHPIPETQQAQLDLVMLQAKALVVSFKAMVGSSALEESNGQEPNDPELFSLWLVGISPLRSREKHAQLSSQNTMQRLEAGIQSLTLAVQSSSRSR